MKKLTLLASLGLLGWTSFAAAQPEGRGQQAMETLDTDGDGVVSYQEFQENGRSPIARLDTDGDEALSLEEFLAARPDRRGMRGGQDSDRGQRFSEEQREEMRARMEAQITERFTAMDADGDGLVSAMEMSEAAFLEMDNDGNGVLSEEELQRPGGRGPRGGGRRGGRGGNSGGQSDQI